MNVFQLNDVSLNYHGENGETEALKKLNFSVEKGEFFGIVGPSGSGKTTVLSLISGVLKPSSGKVWVKDGAKTGYMLQKDHLFEWRTITQNVTLGLEISGDKNGEKHKLAMNLLKKYGLFEFKDSFPSELSGGMRQRVALIRTLVSNPEILLLDEPFSALDAMTRLNVSNDVWKIIKGEKKTAVLVTHDVSEAIATCDRIAMFTYRPATVKRIFDTGFREEDPITRRKSEKFSEKFNEIWREIDDDNK